MDRPDIALNAETPASESLTDASLPLVSIALATYNGEQFLRIQLDSIYAQTYKNIEVVVVDDCSTDATKAILDEYKHKYGLCYFANEFNIGFLRTFEKAFSFCSGDYIALADQDDVWLPNKIQRLVDNIGDYSLITSDAVLIDENGEVFSESYKSYSKISGLTGKPLGVLIFRNYVTGCTTLFRRDLLATALPIPEGETFHDWWLAIVASKMNGIKYLDERLTKYRQHSANTAGIIKSDPFLKRLKLFLFENRTFREPKINFGRMQVSRLSAIRKSPIFSDEDIEIIDDAVAFYEGYIGKDHPLRLLGLSIKRRDYLFPVGNIFAKIKGIAGVLIA